MSTATPSADQVERFAVYSDLYKESRGIRPRWLKPGDHTVEEWDRLIEGLNDDYTVQHED